MNTTIIVNTMLAVSKLHRKEIDSHITLKEKCVFGRRFPLWPSSVQNGKGRKNSWTTCWKLMQIVKNADVRLAL